MLLLALTVTPAIAGNAPAIDSDWILSKLAHAGPTRTSFVEVRSSPLLKTPLRVSGEYRHPDADTLVREVRAPYQETTTIRDGKASIQRGASTRTFALSRAPQLATLQTSFGALLRGDRQQLQSAFALDTSGVREKWKMVLTPKDAALAKQVQGISLFGRGSELRCIETQLAKGGEVQRTLLASAAGAAGNATNDAALQAICHGEAVR
ncbi:MAG: fatty acyl CoA synthetase [Proteobacteria bacterium]|nr:fatty acyl CoA synthetase [Pseudomonadota bacterium]